jgi:hypothetical protein
MTIWKYDFFQDPGFYLNRNSSPLECFLAEMDEAVKKSPCLIQNLFPEIEIDFGMSIVFK